MLIMEKLKRSWCVVQVLVVWDVGIGKARNYRLFEEVQFLKTYKIKKARKNPSYCPLTWF